MAKRGRKKGSKNNNKSSVNSLDFTFIIMLLTTIVLGIIIYGSTGVLTEKLSPVFAGVFGPLKQMLPIFSLALTLLVPRDDQYGERRKIKQAIIVLLLISAAYTMLNVSNGNMGITGKSFSENIKMGYALGTRNQGGGALGTLIAVPLIKSFGVLGATIIDISLIIIMLILLFEISPTDYVSKAMYEIEENKKQKRELRKQRREQLENMSETYVPKKYSQVKYDTETGKIVEEPMPEKHTYGGLFSIFKRKEDKSKIYDVQKDGGVEPINSEIEVEATKNQFISGEEPPDFTMEEKGNIEQIGKAVFETKQKENTPKTELEMTVDPNDIKYEDYAYNYPPIDLLQKASKVHKADKKLVEDTANKLQKTLYSFGVSAKVINASVGPAITRYELKPAVGVKVSKISNLSDDLALNLAAETLRIEAPIPGKQAVGIEVPNKKREMVHLGDVIDSMEFADSKSKISFALGKGVGGETIVADIHKMPHLLIAGSTGSGKSVCVNTIITSIVYKADPNEVKFLMIDPKVVELSMYNSIPHLLVPVITDVQKASAALKWGVSEMLKRYTRFKEERVKDIDNFNEKMPKEERMAKLVIIIDELADLMMASAKEVEELICRIAQMGRAAGIHLVVATQRPSTDVITGLIKTNIPSRIAFAVTSNTDSRIILDKSGAESLLGKGDMLYLPIGEPKALRVQGAFIDEKEIVKVVDYIKRDDQSETSINIQKEIESKLPNTEQIDDGEDTGDDRDPILIDAIDRCVKDKTASISFLRRKFKIGDSRAGRIMDTMEEMGIVSAQEGNKPRNVLVSEYQWGEIRDRYENGGSLEKENDDITKGYEEQTIESIMGNDEEEALENNSNGNSNNTSIFKDPNLKVAIQRVVREKFASASFLERILKISNQKAEEYLNAMEIMGIVSPKQENEPRKVLMDESDWMAVRDTYEHKKGGVNNDILAKSSSFDKAFKIRKGTLNIDRKYVEDIINYTTNEQYFMDAIEDMIEDDEISHGYLRRKYRISDERCEDILSQMKKMNMISSGNNGNSVVTITDGEWQQINNIFDEITS